MMKHHFLTACICLAIPLISCQPEPEKGDAGYNSVVKLSTVDEYEGLCEFGGVRVDTGLDLNRNQMLDEWEIQHTEVLCAADPSGKPGSDGLNGLDTLFFTAAEPPGEHCEHGGLALHWGLDLNRDGQLTLSEITDTDYLCHGAPGKNALIEVAPEERGIHCPYGGMEISTGHDLNENGILDPGEVASVAYVCNTEPGKNALVRLDEEPAGDPCSHGGIRVLSGTDLNGNGELDDDETTFTQVICNPA